MAHVHLDEEAKELLRELHRKAKAGPPVKKAPVTAPMPAVVEAVSVSTIAPDPVSVAKPVVVEEVIAIPAITESGDGSSRSAAAAQIAALAARAEKSTAARGLGTLRETMVFSVGNPEAELMLVGEAPGYHEEREREPFVGPAGQKLNEILKAMGLSREAIYISNIVKFRPAMPGQTTNNRKPTPEEMAACLPFVRAEVGVVRPKCIVALGATAAEGLLGLTGTVAAMRGKWHEFEGIPARVTYHPAYLLHGTAGQGDKRKIWEDMLAVMAQLGLPISDKQRGYFLPKA